MTAAVASRARTDRLSLRNRVTRLLEAPKLVIASVVVLLVVAIAGVFAPVLAGRDPYRQHLSLALKAPGFTGPDGRFWLGTDELGRDVFARLVWGIRPIATVVLISVAIAAAVGFVYGIVAGFARGRSGEAAIRLADVQLSIPPIIVAVLLAVALQPGVTSSIVAIALVTWPQYARVVRSETLRVKTSEYVQLARVAGVRERRILTDHVVPNVMNTFVVLCTLNLSIAIIFAAALSFLGVGVQAPRPDWGNMLAGGTQYLQSWWLVVVPGAAITLVVLAINILGDHLRDVLDPRLAGAPAALGPAAIVEPVEGMEP